MLLRKQSLIESLETRRLLSSATLGADGVLRILGDDLKGNALTVRNSDDGLSVDVTIVSGNPGGTTTTFNRSFSKQGMTLIWMTGGSKGDVILASADNGGLDLPMRADGRSGNDWIVTGSGNDLVNAGGGNDRVETKGGNDRVFGGLGDDRIITADGSDRASGGGGNDHISLEAGNDFARGDAGNDLIEGGDGEDLVYGCGGTDTLTGGNDNDTLWGGFANDIITGGEGNDTLGAVQGANALNGGAGTDLFICRRLALNPLNDFDDALDDVQEVTTPGEGGAVPAV